MSMKSEEVSVTGSINKDPTNAEDKENINVPTLYKKRWLMLLMFSCFSFSNAYQWIHLSIVNDRVALLWNNSLPKSETEAQLAISWLSMVYMLSYIPLIIPAMWFLEHKGLRNTSIIACFLNSLGAWVKCFALSVDGKRFGVLMFGQTLCAISQIFILGIPAHLAAVWFGANEVSTATSLGVFGNQLGIGFGFAIPSFVIPAISSNTTVELIRYRFCILFYSAASVNMLLFIIICFFFQSKPKVPPSWGQILLTEKPQKVNYKRSLRNLLIDMDFMLLVLTYGVNAGCFYAISTVLNEILMKFFKEDSHLIGVAGLTFIVAGVVAASIIGVVMDKTKEFKKIVVTVYLLSLLCLSAFTGGLYLYSWAIVFITIILLGFFMTGYLPIGFEIAAEMTYPENEGLTSGLLNLSAQLFGVIFTYVVTILLKHYSVFITLLCLIISLSGGLILTVVSKIDLKRQKAHLFGAEIEVLNNPDEDDNATINTTT